MDNADTPGREPPPGIDSSVSHSARVWNYWLGGKDNYPADREAGDRLASIQPSIVDIARVSRAFLVRVVRYLAGEVGIRQFLDIGTGLPTANNTHEVAQATAPECRVVYVDNDPLVLVHARALLTSTPEGVTDYVEADLRDPDTILAEAARTLDLTRPVALMLQGVTHHVVDTDEVHAVVRRLTDGLEPGSHLVLGAPSSDGIDGETQQEVFRLWNDSGGKPPVVARSRQEIARFFDHLELLDPGLVSPPLWRPTPSRVGTPTEVNGFVGVGRKP